MLQRSTLVVVTGCTMLAGFGLQPSFAAPSNDAGCPDYLVIDSRGSGRPVGEISPPGMAFIKEFKLFHLDAATEVISNPYPAGGGAFSLVGAKFKIPHLGAYHDSVVLGKRWLRSKISAYLNICESTKVFLVGYSQGAQVTADVVQEPKASEWTNVQGVVLFGDPSYNPSGSSNRYGLNEPDVKKRHTAQRGALHMRSAFNDPKVLSFCHRSDPACQDHGIRLSQHKNYTSFKESEEAAKYFAAPDDVVNDGPKASPAVPDKWPAKRFDGTPALFLHLGASFIWPDWSSCNSNYCLVGSQDGVLVFSVSDGVDEIARIGLGAADPRLALTVLGIPARDIDELLSP